MRFCTNCGEQLADDAKFCTECGQKVGAAAPQPQEASLGGGSPVFSLQDQYGRDNYCSSPAPDTIKPKTSGKKRIIGLAVIIVLLLVAAAVVFFGGSSKTDDAVLGRYEGVSCVVMGTELDVEDEWIELKSGGKAKLRLMEEEYTAKWTLEGEKFTLTQHGDKFTGTLKDNALTVDFGDVVYTFVKEGAQDSAALPSPVAESTEPVTESAEPATESTEPVIESTEPEPASVPSPYDWWEGTWYGWAVISDASGDYAEWIDGCLDCVAEISVNPDGNGYMEINDLDGYPLCQLDLHFDPGSAEFGIMTSGEGSLWDFFTINGERFSIDEGDWVVDPAHSMVSSLDHMICISDTAYSPDSGWFDYYIFLRPWGMDWEDVRTADTSDMLYFDMMPLEYDDWYLPQIGGTVSEGSGLSN